MELVSLGIPSLWLLSDAACVVPSLSLSLLILILPFLWIRSMTTTTTTTTTARQCCGCCSGCCCCCCCCWNGYRDGRFGRMIPSSVLCGINQHLHGILGGPCRGGCCFAEFGIHYRGCCTTTTCVEQRTTFQKVGDSPQQGLGRHDSTMVSVSLVMKNP